MRTAYFDCFAGISGDIIVGALPDLGVSLDALERELRKLKLDGCRLQVSRVRKLGVSATKFDVFLEAEGAERPPDNEFAEVVHPHRHSHELGHGHSHPRDHEHRPLAEMLRILAAPTWTHP